MWEIRCGKATSWKGQRVNHPPFTKIVYLQVYFDVAVGGENVGRLTFDLFGKEAPMITSNFLKVLDGKAQGASYDFSTIWRVQKASWGFWLCLLCVGKKESMCRTGRVQLLTLLGIHSRTTHAGHVHRPGAGHGRRGQEAAKKYQ